MRNRRLSKFDPNIVRMPTLHCPLLSLRYSVHGCLLRPPNPREKLTDDDTEQQFLRGILRQRYSLTRVDSLHPKTIETALNVPKVVSHPVACFLKLHCLLSFLLTF